MCQSLEYTGTHTQSYLVSDTTRSGIPLYTVMILKGRKK